MRHWKLKVIATVVMLALLIAAAFGLYRTLLGLLSIVSTGGRIEISDDEYDADDPDGLWTYPPYIIDDSAYDDVTGVREYGE